MTTATLPQLPTVPKGWHVRFLPARGALELQPDETPDTLDPDQDAQPERSQVLDALTGLVVAKLPDDEPDELTIERVVALENSARALRLLLDIRTHQRAYRDHARRARVLAATQIEDPEERVAAVLAAAR